MKYFILIISLLSIIFINCSKEKLDCDNAQICVKNVGQDTIYYCWGCNIPTEILLSGGKTCADLGPVDADKDEFIVQVDFMSDHGNYIIETQDCYTEKEVY